MKYMKRANLYKASNVTFTPDDKVAASYSWWIFVKEIKGRVIFNDFNYSPSTRKHQYQVRALLRDLGIKIDREVKISNGLNGIDSFKELNNREKLTLRFIAENEERKRIARNEKAKLRRLALKASKQSPVLSLVQGGAA